MKKITKETTSDIIDEMEQLTAAELVITDPVVKMAFYISTYKTPNNNA